MLVSEVQAIPVSLGMLERKNDSLFLGFDEIPTLRKIAEGQMV